MSPKETAENGRERQRLSLCLLSLCGPYMNEVSLWYIHVSLWYMFCCTYMKDSLWYIHCLFVVHTCLFVVHTCLFVVHTCLFVVFCCTYMKDSLWYIHCLFVVHTRNTWLVYGKSTYYNSRHPVRFPAALHFIAVSV